MSKKASKPDAPSSDDEPAEKQAVEEDVAREGEGGASGDASGEKRDKGGVRSKSGTRVELPSGSGVPLAPRSIRGVSSASRSGDEKKASKAASKAAKVNKERPASYRKSGDAPEGKRRRFRRPRWQRKLKFTREGKYFLGITLGVGFAAINTGNNLLYLLLGMMLSLIIVSGVMSELSLRTLTVKRRLPARAQVGRSHLVEIEVYNNKSRVPSYAIEVEDLRAGQPADKRCFFLKISPRSTQIAAYRRTPLKRGLERHTGFRIATRFPFGLFEKSREVDSPDELVIYPAVDPVRLPQRGHGETAGDAGPLGRGAGEEIYALRPMRQGDDPRDIYWRKCTVPGHMVLRERARETLHEVDLLVDNVRKPVPPESDKESTLPGADQFEQRVREVASYAVAHIKRGDRVTVSTAGGERVISDRSRGIDPVLRFLALLQQVDEPSRPRGTKRRQKRRRRGAAA